MAEGLRCGGHHLTDFYVSDRNSSGIQDWSGAKETKLFAVPNRKTLIHQTTLQMSKTLEISGSLSYL